MDYDTAFAYLQRARNLGKERGLEVSVAVHDAAGHPVAVARGKVRSWHGPYMAMGKARLAAAFGKPTSDLVEQWKDRTLFPQSLIEIIPGGLQQYHARINSFSPRQRPRRMARTNVAAPYGPQTDSFISRSVG